MVFGLPNFVYEKTEPGSVALFAVVLPGDEGVAPQCLLEEVGAGDTDLPQTLVEVVRLAHAAHA